MKVAMTLFYNLNPDSPDEALWVSERDVVKLYGYLAELSPAQQDEEYSLDLPQSGVNVVYMQEAESWQVAVRNYDTELLLSLPGMLSLGSLLLRSYQHSERVLIEMETATIHLSQDEGRKLLSRLVNDSDDTPPWLDKRDVAEMIGRLHHLLDTDTLVEQPAQDGL